MESVGAGTVNHKTKAPTQRLNKGRTKITSVFHSVYLRALVMLLFKCSIVVVTRVGVGRFPGWGHGKGKT